MKYLHNIWIGIGLGLTALLTGCEKSEPTAFRSKAAVVFDYFPSVGNKITYSFLGNGDDEYVVRIPVIINGFPEDRDRTFEVEVIQDTITDATASHYRIVPGIIRAGNVKDSLLLTVKKTPDLNDKIVNLYLRVKPTEDFDRGIIERQYFQGAWSNQAIMPTWGTYFRTFFSAVGSTQAYRIFVETTGLTNFALADFRNYQQVGAEVLGKKFGDYIRAWNAANPDNILKHDDGASAGQPIVPRY